MSGKLKKNDDIIWRKVDEDVVIIGKDATRILTLNSTAAYIWEQCDGEKTKEDIVCQMKGEFEVSYQELYKDVTAVIDKLKSRGLLETPEENT